MGGLQSKLWAAATEKVKRGQRPQRAAGGFRLDGRKKSLEEKCSLGGGRQGGCGNPALMGFAAWPDKAKLSPVWCWWQSCVVQEGNCRGSGSSFQPAFLWLHPLWIESKSKYYLYTKQLDLIQRRSQGLKLMRREEAHFPLFVEISKIFENHWQQNPTSLSYLTFEKTNQPLHSKHRNSISTIF